MVFKHVNYIRIDIENPEISYNKLYEQCYKEANEYMNDIKILENTLHDRTYNNIKHYTKHNLYLTKRSLFDLISKTFYDVDVTVLTWSYLNEYQLNEIPIMDEYNISDKTLDQIIDYTGTFLKNFTINDESEYCEFIDEYEYSVEFNGSHCNEFRNKIWFNKIKFVEE